jgi:DNA-binding NarL/FixJ family response regulator/EAL domain-containing protein (putative c-di-GMP-specific phosphodiesterase class I)
MVRLIGAEEAERERIAADIHDDPLQVMASAVLRLGMLARELPEPAHQDSVHRVTLAIEAAIGRLRRLAFELNPPSLAASTLCEALRGYMVEYARESPVGWTVSDRLSEQPSGESKQMLFRVAQEALRNVRKHAGAQRVEILIAPVDGGTLLQVKDDGVGFVPDDAWRAHAGHIGMSSMRERMQRAGGWLEVRSVPGAGAVLEAWLPPPETGTARPTAPVEPRPLELGSWFVHEPARRAHPPLPAPGPIRGQVRRRDTFTVLIADDDVNYRLALAAVIDHEPTLALVGVARSGAEAISLALELAPDVVLVDVRMGGGDGIAVARELTHAGVRSRVLALSAYDDHSTVMQMLDAGAAGYLLKGRTVESLVEGIAKVARETPAAGGAAAPSARPNRSIARRTLPNHTPGTSVRAEPTRVLLVDDNPGLLGELIAVIEAEPGFEVVGSTAVASEAVSLATFHQPHVALIDWRTPGGGIDVVAEIRERSPATQVVGISIHRHPQIVMAMLRAGARGFIAKPVRSDDLVASLRAAANGHMSLAPELSGPVLDQLVLDLQDRERARDEWTLMRERVQAAIHGPVSMAFQPIVSLADNAAVAVEALARFSNEPRQMANVWFREAARCGLIVDLDMITMTKALEALEWLPREVSLHINLAPETLFAGHGAELLDLVEPERVVVEITEHSDIADYAQLNQALAPLRERGVKLAVDDVGAGFSSLRHVLVLEPDMIKLDVSLCRGIDSNGVRRALARALTAFGQEIDKVVVAEGVETESELEALRELGVTHAQGYLLGRPDLSLALRG